MAQILAIVQQDIPKYVILILRSHRATYSSQYVLSHIPVNNTEIAGMP